MRRPSKPLPTADGRSRDLLYGPAYNAINQVAEWSSTRPEDAQLIQRIAQQPQGIWLGDWSGNVQEAAASASQQAAAMGAVPVFVLYNIPIRDCDNYSGGGASSASAYRAWIDGVVSGIADSRAAVIVEPDAIALSDCLTSSQAEERYSLLNYAVDQLSGRSHTSVYLDIGHSAWLSASEAANRLRRAGIDRARGFSLNVSNFQWTTDQISYGQAISSLLGGDQPARWIVDTSRNGNGPWITTDPQSWCNPPGRALGQVPTTNTGHDLVDAFLWVKPPGESDGPCRGWSTGWLPLYALELVRNSS